MVAVCCCVNCKNEDNPTSRAKKISFHKFPLSPHHRASWVTAIHNVDPVTMHGWTPNKHSRVCSKHFRPEDFKLLGGVTFLAESAVPSRFNLPSPPKEVDVDDKFDLKALSVKLTRCDPVVSPLKVQEVTSTSKPKGNRGRKVYAYPITVQGTEANQDVVPMDTSEIPVRKLKTSKTSSTTTTRGAAPARGSLVTSAGPTDARQNYIFVGKLAECQPKDDDDIGLLKAKIECVLGHIRAQNVSMKLVAEQFRSAVEKDEADEAAKSKEPAYLIITKNKPSESAWPYSFKVSKNPPQTPDNTTQTTQQ